VSVSVDVPQAGRDLAARAAYEAKCIVAAYPWLAIPAARLRGHGELVRPDTDILIEGYPRSANSFSVAAFRLAQGRPVEVAHHTHAPAHVIAALELGIPTMVLTREPEESVLEFVLVRPNLTVRQVLRGWVRFYKALLPYRRRFVVGAFPEVTSDFGPVIRRLNLLYGSNFREFEHTEENVRECFRQMDAYWRGRLGEDESIEAYVGRPSPERERWKDSMRPDYLATPAVLRTRAASLYRTFVRGEGR
jgi:hypothetical protein